jgi:hypothetical protein
MASVQKSAFLFLSLLIFLKNCVQCPNEDELQASVTVQEQRAFIKISVLLNQAATEIHKELETALGYRAYSLRRVRELAHEYQTRQRLSCEDLPRSGRPVTADTPENRETLQALMAQGRAWRIDDLLDELELSHGSVWHMLNEMGYRKLPLSMCHMPLPVTKCKLV